MRRALRTCSMMTAVALAGCSVQETPAPLMTGPSELALRVSLQAIPDSILQDGASQAAIQIDASGPDGRPMRALPLRLEILLGASLVDYGLLSAKTVVTGDDGRARAVYTAPPRPAEPVDPETVVTIRATPIGTDYRGEVGRTVDLRLVTPGVILPPNQAPRASFSITPATPLVQTNVVFDASASTDEGQPCGVPCTYSWEFGDGAQRERDLRDPSVSSPRYISGSVGRDRCAAGPQASPPRRSSWVWAQRQPPRSCFHRPTPCRARRSSSRLKRLGRRRAVGSSLTIGTSVRVAPRLAQRQARDTTRQAITS